MDTFIGQAPNVLHDAPDAARSHRKASECYRKAAYYRRAEWLGFRIGRYEATVNHRAVIEKARKAGDHYAAVARMLERDMRNYNELRRGEI